MGHVQPGDRDLLVYRVGRFDARNTRGIAVFAAGWLLLGVMLARAFGEVFAARHARIKT